MKKSGSFWIALACFAGLLGSNLPAWASSWSSKANLPAQLFSGAAVELGGKNYFIGGLTPSVTPVSSVFCYDPASGLWSAKSAMPTPHFDFAAVVLQGRIYAISGRGSNNDFGFTGNVASYDPATDQWTSRNSLPEARRNFFAGTINDTIYVFGGRVASNTYAPVASGLKYQASTDTWSSAVAPMLEATDSGEINGGVVINGKLYIVGRSASGMTAQVYNPTTNTWSWIPDPPTDRSFFSVGMAQGMLYVMGGTANSLILDKVEFYDPRTGVWRVDASMPVQKFETAVVSYDNKIDLVGGHLLGSGVSTTVEVFTPSYWFESAVHPERLAPSDGPWTTSGCDSASIDGTLHHIAGQVWGAFMLINTYFAADSLYDMTYGSSNHGFSPSEPGPRIGGAVLRYHDPQNIVGIEAGISGDSLSYWPFVVVDGDHVVAQPNVIQHHQRWMPGRVGQSIRVKIEARGNHYWVYVDSNSVPVLEFVDMGSHFVNSPAFLDSSKIGFMLYPSDYNLRHAIQWTNLSVGPPAGVSVAVPDTIATYNQSLTVPVRVNNTSGSGIVSFELALLYNRWLLSGAAVQTAGTLAQGWTIQSNIISRPDSIDTLKIAAAHTTALSGAGTLLNLNFQVVDVRHPAWSQLTLAHVLLNTGTPEGIADHGSVTLVGVNGTINSMPPAVIPRHAIAVTVNEMDEDRNPGTVQHLGVQVRNGLQTEFLNVAETGANTGVFTGTMATVFSAAPSAPSGDGIVQAKVGDVIQFCYIDSLPALGGPFGSVLTRCDTTRVVGGKDGRTRITVVSQPGDTVRVRVVDGDLNANAGAVESTTVSGVNVRTGESEVLTLTEKSASDSVFFGILRTTLGSSGGANNDGVLNTRKADSLVVTYADTLTSLGGTAVAGSVDKVVNPFGDADGNGSVQAYDAARVLFHVLAPFLVGIDSLSANVDLLAPFGQISPYDASLILQKRVGLIGRFPVQEDEADNHPQPETDQSTPKRVVEQRVLSLQEGAGYWSVVADERGGILSGEVVLGGVEGKVELSPDLQEYLIASRSGEGMLRVVFAGAVPISGPGELLRVYSGVGPGSVQLTRAELNDGTLGVVLSGVTAGVEVPTSYALLGNWPNPFNPETTIGFALPERSAVTLEVYDVLGQRVRVLVGRELPAGQHQVVWDGRDGGGRPVSSGVYLYRLQAGAFSQLKRMVMIK